MLRNLQRNITSGILRPARKKVQTLTKCSRTSPTKVSKLAIRQVLKKSKCTEARVSNSRRKRKAKRRKRERGRTRNAVDASDEKFH